MPVDATGTIAVKALTNGTPTKIPWTLIAIAGGLFVVTWLVINKWN